MTRPLSRAALAFVALFALLPGCGKKDATPSGSSSSGDAPADSAGLAPPPVNPVVQYETAVGNIPRCTLNPDGVTVKDMTTCLKPVWDALKLVDSPPDSVKAGEKEALRKQWSEQLGRVLTANLASPNQTIVLYTLFQNQTRFPRTPETLKKFEQLMNGPNPDIADWAAIARFWRVEKDDAASLDLANTTLKTHKLDRVRLSACNYVGDRMFHNDRSHYTTLLGYAKDTTQPDLVRSCAVTHLGDVGQESDVPEIAELLRDKKVQYAAVYALQLGIRTKKSFDAYVDYFAKNATKDDAIFFGALTIFAPWESDMDKFPKAKAVRALSTMLATKSLQGFTRGNAAMALGKLKAKDELNKAHDLYKNATTDDDKRVNDQIEKAIRDLH